MLGTNLSGLSAVWMWVWQPDTVQNTLEETSWFDLGTSRMKTASPSGAISASRELWHSSTDVAHNFSRIVPFGSSPMTQTSLILSIMSPIDFSGFIACLNLSRFLCLCRTGSLDIKLLKTRHSKSDFSRLACTLWQSFLFVENAFATDVKERGSDLC